VHENKPRRSTSKECAKAYQLEIVLSGIPVWRRLLVRGDINLGLLHATIQVAMGWTNSHLHQFMIGKKRYSDPTTQDEPFLGELPDLDESKAVLMEVAPKAKAKIIYEYDFGDSWMHLITVEKIHDLDIAGLFVAQCLDGGLACPPEDCGGIGGYANLLQIIGNPEHEERESMMEWLGDEFDPNAFDIGRVNRHLKKLKWPRTTVNQLARVLMGRDGYQA
jgi:hypothetical protein